MEITNELLAAYAEGLVSKEERDAVRKYLAENPSELESIMMMMDEDYEIEPKTEEKCGGKDVSFPTLSAMSAIHAVSFAPSISFKGRCGNAVQSLEHSRMRVDAPMYADLGNFNSRLDTLLDEIKSL